MRFRPARIVRVTRESELDAALASADQVVVEGDDRLLTLAVSRAAGDPGNRIDLDLHGETLYGTGDAGELFGNAKTAEFPFDRKKAAWHRLPLWVGIVLLLLALAGAVYVALHGDVVPASSPVPPPVATEGPSAVPPSATPESPSPTPPRDSSAPRTEAEAPRPDPSAPRPDPSTPRADVPPAPASGIGGVLPSLAWPAVAIVAIIALFFIARQAIAGGRNLDISWKVTEKVAGRVVITKVKSPARRARVPA